MIDLNNLDEIKKLDPKDVLSSTGMFVDQCNQILDTYFEKEFYPPEYKSIKNIIMCGMGGSAYGGHIISSLFSDSIKVPFQVVSDYHLPSYVNQDSLVLLASYSGSTEEVLSCFNEAKTKKAKITGFTSGGKLGELLKDIYPGFIFKAQFNPSNQPRLGTGYMVLSTITLLISLGVINVSKDEIISAVNDVKNDQSAIKDKAIHMAKSLFGYFPIIFSAEHLVGNAHIMRNQFNETSKSFSAFEDIPELNHHLMEGLKYPKDKKLKVIFIESDLYFDIVKRRIELTQDVIVKNDISFLRYKPESKSQLGQVLQVLLFGGYITLFLAFLYGEDPSLIPWVDYFKKELTK